ncbi:MAG: hypothetical protein Q7S76_01535 [bacterium]|nr:hypothetical protein [bacterium]
MKKIILITVLIIGGIPITLFVIGMGIGLWQIVTDQSTVDCSNDSKCLAKYVNACTDTKVIAAQYDMVCFPDNMNTCQDVKTVEAMFGRGITELTKITGTTVIMGIKKDFVLFTHEVKNDEGKEVCRVYMSSFLHKDQAATSKMSTEDVASIDNILGSDEVVAENERIDSCDYSDENWKYIGDEMSTLAAGSLLDHPKAENCTSLVQDLSKMTPEEYQSAKEGYQRLLKTGSSAN